MQQKFKILKSIAPHLLGVLALLFIALWSRSTNPQYCRNEVEASTQQASALKSHISDLESLVRNLTQRLSSLEQNHGSMERKTKQHERFMGETRKQIQNTSWIQLEVNKHCSKSSLSVATEIDYASYFIGARIEQKWTSQTFYWPSSFKFLDFFQIGRTYSNPPAVVLHPSVQIGQCWAFSGQTGHIAIKVAFPIIPSKITIYHVPIELTPDISTAPQIIFVYAVYGSGKDHTVSQKDTKQMNPKMIPSVEIDEIKATSLFSDVSNPVFKVLIARVLYPKDAPGKFSVDVDNLMLLPSSHILLEIAANHGNKQITCLYRVEINGKANRFNKL